MSSLKVGFIGGGNMAYAIAEGLSASNKVEKNNIIICEISIERRDFLASQKYNVTSNIGELTDCDLVFLAVKPIHALNAVKDFSQYNTNKCTIVSIVAGLSTQKLCNNTSCGIIRIMPNTPTLVGEGMFAISDDYIASEEALIAVKDMLGSIGKVSLVPAHLMDAVTAISGSGPAYVFMFIDAMINAGVRIGLTRAQATELTLQTVKGATEMVQQSDLSPSDLKDMVCSPAGTTIEAVYTLEKGGFNALIMEAIKKCEEKSRSLSGN